MAYFQQEIETASREQITAWQNERLAATVKRVYDNVPLYRERMDAAGVKPEDIKTIEDLTKLPYTSKQDLRDTYPYGMFAVPMKDVVRLHASSGTTGKQIVVGYTQHDLDVWADICARQLVAVGATPEDKIHVSYGYGLFTGGFGLHGGAEKLGCVSIPVSSGNTARQLTIMQDFGSDVLACTPSYAMYLGESAEKAGID
ncbi:MAG: phenylacetate--CoA ligase, partial [Clostridia bacterium]|nr:phenylacetate--CoA ligase [Clostridia bacterium]